MSPAANAKRALSSRAWQIVTGREALEPLTALAWIAFLALLAVQTVGIATNDFREHPLAGDQSSFLLQAQSLAHGLDLSFDRDDFDRFVDLEWAKQPVGLFFQRHDDGWAFAKPYGYPAIAAPAVAVFGAVRGMAITNAFLLLALVAVSIAILRVRFSGPVVPLVVGAFYLLATPYLYGYVLHSELFLALLVASALGLTIWFWRAQRLALAVAAMAAMAFGVSEKPPLLVLFLPVVALLLIEQRNWRHRVAIVAAAVGVWGLAVVPYLVYSDGRTWNAYGGERYVAAGRVPFDGARRHPDDSFMRSRREEYFTLGVVARLFDRPGDRVRSGIYYFVGRHTGLLVFLPTALFLLIAALARARRIDLHAWTVLAGIAAYVLFYVLFFPKNYVGVSSLGNRYFVQIAPAVLVAAVLAEISRRVVASVAVAGAVLGVVLLWPHHRHPSAAFSEQLNETTTLQRIFPFEQNFRWRGYFVCPDPYTVGCITREAKLAR